MDSYPRAEIEDIFPPVFSFTSKLLRSFDGQLLSCTLWQAEAAVGVFVKVLVRRGPTYATCV